MQDALRILEAARQAPSAPAIVTPAGTLSFEDVAVRVRRVVAWLARPDAPRGGVAIVAAVRVETLVAIYALLEAGIPVVLIHPRATPSERAVLLEVAGHPFVLDDSWSDGDLPPAPDELAAPPAHASESVAAIMFTSGTSGRPKAVRLSRRAFLAAAEASAANLGWREDDRWLLCMPIAHVGGLSVISRCLVARRTVVLSPWTGAIAQLLDDVARYRVTILSFVPTMLSRLFEELPDYRFPDHVRVVMLGGDASSPRLLEEAAARKVPIVATYGLTEACSQVATQAPGDPVSAESGVGRPLRGTEVRIADGEVQVRGPTMMTGYGARASDASVQTPPFLEGGWFPTGDLGSFDAEGRLHVHGRKTDRIITGGENVDPLEVEVVLTACPGVAAACVFGVPSERWGQTVAAALIAADPASPPSLDRIAAHVEEHLATFKRPRAVAFCPDFVRNATGKVHRRKTAATARAALARLPRSGSG